MTLQIEKSELDTIIELTKNFARTNMPNQDNQQETLENIFWGTQRRSQLLDNIRYEDRLGFFAQHLIIHFIRFGKPDPDKEALGIFIDYMLENMGINEEVAFLEGMLKKYPMLPKTSPPTVSLPRHPIKDADQKYIFISYAHADIEYARIVHQVLEQAGFRIFRDEKDIKVGDDWDKKISEALDQTTHMVLLLSKTSMPDRREVRREWFYFDTKRQAPILPLLLEDCKINDRLINRNYADARKDFEAALKQLLSALNGNS
jgi:hypothetical protein